MLLLLIACIPTDSFTRIGDDSVWMLTWGAGGSDELWALDRTGDGDLIVVAHETDGDADLAARRFDAAGEIVWSTTWQGPFADMAYIATVAGDTAYVGGTTFAGLGSTQADPLVLALDIATGATRWSWTLDPSGGYEEVDGICVRDDDLWFTGWTGWGASATGNDPMIGLLSTDGEMRWVVADTGGPAWDEANGHCVCDGSQVWITGNRDGVTYALGGQGVVAAYDATDGSRLWQADLDADSAQEDGYGLVGDAQRLYAVGPSVVGAQTQITVWATDHEGALLWATDWGDDGADIARAIALDGDSLVVAGTAGTDLALLRFAVEDGALLDELRWSPGSTINAHEIVVDGESVWVGGQMIGDGDDAFLIHGQARPFGLPEVE